MVACINAARGLDLPADVPPGILADAVALLRSCLEDAKSNGSAWGSIDTEDLSRILDKLAPVSPPESKPYVPQEIQERLDYLRGEIEAERISYGEIAELQDLAPYIDPDDTVLLEWAGVPEFPEDGETPVSLPPASDDIARDILNPL
jgi:hypothetical protein